MKMFNNLMSVTIIILCQLVLFSTAVIAQDHDESEHEHNNDVAHAESDTELHETSIPADAAQQAGILVSQAGPGVIAQTVTAVKSMRHWVSRSKPDANWLKFNPMKACPVMPLRPPLMGWYWSDTPMPEK